MRAPGRGPGQFHLAGAVHTPYSSGGDNGWARSGHIGDPADHNPLRNGQLRGVCGERGIRTPKSLRTPVFKTGAIAVLPALQYNDTPQAQTRTPPPTPHQGSCRAASGLTCLKNTNLPRGRQPVELFPGDHTKVGTRRQSGDRSTHAVPAETVLQMTDRIRPYQRHRVMGHGDRRSKPRCTMLFDPHVPDADRISSGPHEQRVTALLRPQNILAAGKNRSAYDRSYCLHTNAYSLDAHSPRPSSAGASGTCVIS